MQPDTNRGQNPGRRRAPRLLLLGGLLTAMLALGNDVREPALVLNDYRIKEFAADGSLAWIIYGEKATARGDEVVLEKAQLQFETGDGPIRVFSPRCRFLRDQNRGSSEQPVHLRSETMTIDGVGFDLDLAGRRLRVRQRVKVRIFDPDVHLLDSAPKQD